MTPPRARTWGRRGHTPVIRVRGRSRRRTSVAALCCYKPGEKSRLIHRPRTHLLLKGARKSFSWKDYRDLLVRAHIQLGGPIVVVWDNLNTHLAAGLKRYEAEHDWLTTVRLPPYAPDLNPVEAVWSLVRRAMANTAFDTPEDLDRKLRRELRRIQLRPRLIDGCLSATAALTERTRQRSVGIYPLQAGSADFRCTIQAVDDSLVIITPMDAIGLDVGSWHKFFAGAAAAGVWVLVGAGCLAAFNIGAPAAAPVRNALASGFSALVNELITAHFDGKSLGDGNVWAGRWPPRSGRRWAVPSAGRR
ncbi:IS630 family transposase [Streptomyces sp. Mg1]|nr:IS630 family transposase [Streptomyces sp. Mg1]